MKKALLTSLLLMAMLLCPINVLAAVYSDVPDGTPYHDAVDYLSDQGIITGYDDKTFKPENPINRVEAAALIVRTAGLDTSNVSKNNYTDVADNHWGCQYIMAATDAGIVNGIDTNLFAPLDNVTHYQILTMIARMLGLEESANAAGGWPLGFVEIAYDSKIIDEDTYANLQNSENGKMPANRGEVAQYVYNAVYASDADKLIIAGKEYYLGMKATELGKADEIAASSYGFLWYIFGTTNYRNFFAAGVADNGTVVALASVGKGFRYNGLKAGDTVSNDFPYADKLFTDKNDNNAIHGVLLLKNGYDQFDAASSSTLAGESKMNYHCTNAFRIYHGLAPLFWSSKAALAARLHSQDMADNNYFSHNSKDGTGFMGRMKNANLIIFAGAENIYGGEELGFLAYHSWVNSSGHRANMLGDYDNLGIGAGYNGTSNYKCYFTQDFFSN